ncbi:unnamed protein product, partial [Symbiodinium microadriaticum]
EPDSHCNVVLLGTLEESDWELAFAALEVLPAGDTRQIASVARVGAARWMRSLELMRKNADTSNIYVYNALAASAAPWQRASALLGAATASGLRLDAVGYCSALSASADARVWAHSLKLFWDSWTRTIAPDDALIGAAILACPIPLLGALRASLRRFGIVATSASASAAAIVARKDCEAAMELAAQGSEGPLDEELLGSLLTMATKATRWASALAALRLPQSAGLLGRPGPVATAASKVFADAACWAEAMSLARQLAAAGSGDMSEVCANALKALDQVSGWEYGHRLFEDLLLWHSELDAVCYNCAVTTCRQGQQWEQAVARSESSRAAHATASQDPVLFGGVVSACGQGSAWRPASELLRTALRARAESDLVLLSSGCMAAEKGGHWQAALWTPERTAAAGLPQDVVLRNSVLAASGHWPRSLGLLQEAENATIVSFSAVLAACEQGSAWSPALLLLRGLSHHGLEANSIAMATAVDAAVSGDQWQHALVMFAAFCQRGGECDLAACGALLAECEQSGMQRVEVDLLGLLGFTLAPAGPSILGELWRMTQSNMRSLARAVGLVACICAPLTSGTEVFHSIGTQACKTEEDLTNLLQIIPDWQQLSHESHEGQHVHEGQHSHEGQGHVHGHAKNAGKAGVAGVTSRRISQTQQSAQLHEHGTAQTNNSGNATSSSATASCVDLIHQCRNDFDWNSCVGFESRCYNAAKAVQLIQIETQQSQASAPVVRTNLDCDTWSLRCQSQDWTACLHFEDHCQQASPRPTQLSLAFASSSISQPTFQSARRVEEGQDCESLISQCRNNFDWTACTSYEAQCSRQAQVRAATL